MHLRYIVWAWEIILGLLSDRDPGLGRLVTTNCRPLAVDQQREGVLHVIVGCAGDEALAWLSQPQPAEIVATAIGLALDLKIELMVVAWPGQGPARGEDLPAIVPAKAPQWLLGEAAKCETPLERLFLVQASGRGIRLAAQHSLTSVRVDLAEVKKRVAIDVYGWFRRRDPAHERGHRIAEAGWIGLSFAGEDVYAQADRCLDTLERALRRR